MSTLLLDTNIVSFIMKKDTRAEDYRPHLQGLRLAISFMTIAELYEGAYRGKWGKKWFKQLALTVESYTVLESSLDLCVRWGDIRCQRRRQPISTDDAWIAATALVYDVPLVTHNAADFQDIPDLRLITATPT